MRFSWFRPARPSAPEYQVLQLTVAPATDQAGETASKVMARLASCGDAVGAVILTLEGDLHPSSMPREALYALGCGLQASSIRLHVVIGARDARQSLEQCRLDGTESPLAVHPTLRSAVLASYAELPGPALVTAAVRAALVTPAAQVQTPAEPAGHLEPIATFSHRRATALALAGTGAVRARREKRTGTAPPRPPGVSAPRS